MAEFGAQETLTLQAAADLSACLYHVARLSAAQSVNIASNTAADTVVGVLQTNPKSGEFGTVAYLGKTKVVAGGSITAGALITCNGSGRAAAVASGGWYFGRALETSNADGQIISALLTGGPILKSV